MIVRFIAHAGMYIEEEGDSLLIDPWFRGSSLTNPVLKSILGKHETIDFQIPPTTEKIEDYKPNAVLVSHFHTHHSPQDDVLELLSQQEEVRLLFPNVSNVNIEKLSVFKNVKAVPFDDGNSTTIGSLSITGITHTVPGHIAWYIKGKTGSVLHVADARVNKDVNLRTLDSLWEKFTPLHPSLMCMSVGGNAMRKRKGEERSIQDASVFTPGEAANLIGLIKPQAASVIGCFNKSLWSTLGEYLPPSYVIEDEFYWALSWTAPDTRVVYLRPGLVINIGERTNYPGVVL